ncbi:hypothetical protein B7494_g1417 [Chlorociboria aeruginascens]|nr:hypothetical protein B7494_g1417 [Chlorociboria aeruginascens]
MLPRAQYSANTRVSCCRLVSANRHLPGLTFCHLSGPMSINALLDLLGPEVDDPEEGCAFLYYVFSEAKYGPESFLLFSQSIPSQDLGFINSKAKVLELSIGHRDLVIHQSPTILSSNRGGGTTGAVVWKITPLFATWITSLFKHDILPSNSTVLELGCGIAGIIGLALAPYVESYVLTDQEYVSKLVKQNLLDNQQDASVSSSRGRKNTAKSNRGYIASNTASSINVIFKPLDWETDEVTTSLTASEITKSFDIVIACDCIYNDALIKPLIDTCVDVCQLRQSDTEKEKPTICIVAQQLRSSEVFEEWLKSFHESFRVWRVPDAELISGLKENSGFVIHIGILR